MVIVVMGVTGCGKSTIGRAIAERLGLPFQEGDALHPPANIAKMSAGIPLCDQDRWPWLASVAAWIDERRAAGGGGVVSCSALKRAYRDVLVGDRPDVRLVHLRGDRDTIAARQAGRRGHFMPTSLLESQFATLEEPDESERPIRLDVSLPVDQLVDMALRAFAGPR